MKKITTFLVALFLLNAVFAQVTKYSYQYEVVKIDSVFDKNPNLTIETYINVLSKTLEKKMSVVIGTSTENLQSFDPASPLSNLLVDMLFDWGNSYLVEAKRPVADFALLNFGGIRAHLNEGKITVGDIYRIAPFDNSVVIMKIKGSELRKMFSVFSEKNTAPMANTQTIYRTSRLQSYTINNQPLDDEKLYQLVTIDFLAFGGDGFLENVIAQEIEFTSKQLRDIFIEAIRKKTELGVSIYSKHDDRVIFKPTP